MKKLSTIFFFLLIATMSSAKTGSLRVQILDNETGKPLYKALACIEETKQGAFANKEGYALLKNINANTKYRIVCKFVGYNTETIQNMCVSANKVTTYTVRLSESQTNGCSFRYEATASTNISELLTLKPGVVSDSSYGFTISSRCVFGKRAVKDIAPTNNPTNTFHVTEFSCPTSASMSDTSAASVSSLTSNSADDVDDGGVHSDTHTPMTEEKEMIAFTTREIQPVQIFPNPASSFTELSFEASRPGNAAIMLFDSRGALCMNINEYVAVAGRVTKELELSGLPEGVYTVHAIQDAELRTGRFILKK